MPQTRTIEPVLDGLRFETHGLNCYIVPKYLAASTLVLDGGLLFYTYLYLYAHYSLLGQQVQNDFFQGMMWVNSIEEPAAYVLQAKLGMELLTLPVAGDLCTMVRHYLDQGWLVLVPTDKQRYPYVSLTEPTAHMLLITGYDPESQAFLIHDGVQNEPLLSMKLPAELVARLSTGRGGTGLSTIDPPLKCLADLLGDVYTSFSMTPQFLEDSFRSYNRHFSFLAGHLQVMRCQDAAAAMVPGAAVADICGQLSRYQSQASSLIGGKFQALLGPGMLRQKLQFVNSYRIFLCGFLALLARAGIPAQETASLEPAALQCYLHWKQLLMLAGVKQVRGEQFSQRDARASYRQVLRAERAFLRRIASLQPTQ